MSERLVRALPGLKKVAAQLTYMSMGSALFFFIKVVWVYLAEQIGIAAWLSYLLINVALTIMGWTYHSKVTFKTALNRQSAWRYVHAAIGLKLFDYFGFVFLTYAGHIHPVLSVVIMGVLQVGARFITYSNYVFHEDETKADRRLAASKILLGAALLAGATNYMLSIDGSAPRKDGQQNYCLAANLYAIGVFSSNCEGDAEAGAKPQPTMKREPGLPALLALTFALGSRGLDVRECAVSNSDRCKQLRAHQRMLLFLPILALIVLVYFAAKDITANKMLAAAAALCAALGTGLIESSLAFLTEPLAAALLLLVAWMLHRIVARPRPVMAGLICGTALGALTLTKAIYFYFLPVFGLITLFALLFRSWRATASGGIVAVVVAGLIASAWIARNHELFETTAIAGRYGNVMGIRAQFTTMTWRQYWTAYLIFTPKLGPKLVALLGADAEDAAMFDRENPNGFIQRYRRGEGPVSIPKGGDQPEMRAQALAAFAEHWPMQLALVPLTIYRSAFLPVGSNVALRSGPIHILRLVLLAIATIITLAMMPAFLLNIVIDTWRLNFAKLAFHFPALYTVGVHSVMTHYIPRYNLPLFGVFAIELCMAAYFLWTLVVGSKDGQAEGVQSAT